MVPSYCARVVIKYTGLSQPYSARILYIINWARFMILWTVTQHCFYVAEHVPDTRRSCSMAWTFGVWDLAASGWSTRVQCTSCAATRWCHSNVMVEYFYSIVHCWCSGCILLYHRICTNSATGKSPSGMRAFVVVMYYSSLLVCVQTAVVSETDEGKCTVILWSLCIIVCCSSDTDGSSLSS